jgi:hypothetical protein
MFQEWDLFAFGQKSLDQNLVFNLMLAINIAKLEGRILG